MDFLPGHETPFVPLRSRGELPHLYKPGATYFVTFRQWDAVVAAPSPVLTPTHLVTPDSLPAEIVGGYDPPICLGSCALADPQVARVVRDALLYFDSQRYDLLAWCVMPNHVHAVLTPIAPYTPDLILHSWKSYTSNVINRMLGRRGTFWERESFDHLVRSIASLERFIRYVEENPVIAGLCERAEDWEWSSARCSLLR
jgi:REP element-mobilizing transposase RayT